MLKDEIEKKISIKKDKKKKHESTRLTRQTHDSSHKTTITL
jgi:hypothetical protein